MNYINAVGAELRKSWWSAIVVVVFTVCRFLFGWHFFEAGWGKMTSGWITNGKPDAGGKIQTMVTNLQHAHGPDPLHLNNVLVWCANHLFIPMSGLTDFLVVTFEMCIGLFVFFGFGIFWTMIAALFLNLQFATAGSANNFGYIVTDIVWFRFPKYAGMIGVDGYIRYKQGKPLLDTGIGRGKSSSGDASFSDNKGSSGNRAPM